MALAFFILLVSLVSIVAGIGVVLVLRRQRQAHDTYLKVLRTGHRRRTYSLHCAGPPQTKTLGCCEPCALSMSSPDSLALLAPLQLERGYMDYITLYSSNGP